jgi:hypothetical protein
MNDTCRQDMKTCTFKVLLQNVLEGYTKIWKHSNEDNRSWTETCDKTKILISEKQQLACRHRTSRMRENHS